MTLLLLGGTQEARQLAERWHAAGVSVIYSLAGRTTPSQPSSYPSRSGGFGGVTGLVQYLQQQRIRALVDISHPFAQQISLHAQQASQITGTPLYAYRRPAWFATPEDDWREYANWPDLLQALQPFQRPLFTAGVGVLAYPVPAHQQWTVRCITAQTPRVGCQLRLERGPFTLSAETALLANHDVLVSKHSGGTLEPKLLAARQLRRPVLLLARPVKPWFERCFDALEPLYHALL